MSDDQQSGQPSAIPPGRVLTLGRSDTSEPLRHALSGAGHRVEIVEDAAELTRRLSDAVWDAIVIDLAPGQPGAGRTADVATALATVEGVSGGTRPIVVVLSAPGSPAGPALRADLRMSGPPADAVKGVEAAIAFRRIEELAAENERLQRAVTHARHTAHDLAQPLTTILARCQLLMTRIKPEDPHHRAVSIICQEADRLAGLIEGFQRLKEMAAARR